MQFLKTKKQLEKKINKHYYRISKYRARQYSNRNISIFCKATTSLRFDCCNNYDKHFFVIRSRDFNRFSIVLL